MTPTAAMQLATELRDTLLQDLVAVSMMVRYARDDAQLSPEGVLEDAESILSRDLTQLREVISRLGPPA